MIGFTNIRPHSNHIFVKSYASAINIKTKNIFSLFSEWDYSITLCYVLKHLTSINLKIKLSSLPSLI